MLKRRREFLKNAALLGIGGVSGAVFGPAFIRLVGSHALAQDTTTSPEQRLKALKLELPKTSKPAYTYVPAVLVGDMLYVSGHIGRNADGTTIAGKVGPNVSLVDAIAAARTVGLAVLATVRDTLGSLDRVERLVKTLGMVNCSPEFSEQPKVINGFSDLMVEVFGPEAGKGPAGTVGVGSLPLEAVVEVEAIFKVRP